MIDWTDRKLISDTRQLLDVLSMKWALPILAALKSGPRRHNDLHRAAGGSEISNKVFEETLRRMIDRGLLARKEREQKPPVVYYELSPTATCLMALLEVFVGEVHNSPLLRELARNSRGTAATGDEHDACSGPGQ